ncbi:Stk1 family PASTA domain-containing Ser/Thr kinase [Amycolatopsis aidingensis]|uniref:Stk1 family PASTA domain-containing Ser/Thr kinase n=1 Tax=Amycolatopsis aidingensis TaxID=2842453 RepID=UPI001C0DD697|nr:Stk1 family PASTA domain-containing Ser/Thr kinase [Amycolatopsis aidingensis]
MSAPRLLSNRYELGDTLGYGGMSEVHHGHDVRLGREVAVKILRADLARDPQFQERFRREAQNAAALNHPAIVAVYDTGEANTEYGPLPYIVMEYVEGRTLRDIVKTEGPMAQKRAMEVMADVSAALDFSHRHGIVHRDVKPANVMITRSGAVKVMDFGIARAVHDGQAAMTQTAAVIGTAQYLSPEQARGESVDARSDVYAAGCVLYELVTGEPPFTGDSPVAVAYQHVREDPQAPSAINPAVSPELDAVVLKALAKGPANRYQSAAEMRSDLVRTLSGQRPSAPMVMSDDDRTQVMGAGNSQADAYDDYDPDPYDPDEERRRRKRRNIMLALAAVLGVALIAFIAWLAGAFNEDAEVKAVPSVIGQNEQQARDLLYSQGFTNVETKKVACSPVPDDEATCTSDQIGRVVETSPAAETRIPVTDKITLSVGTKPEATQVPELKGKTRDEAEQALKEKGFVLGQVEEVDVQDSDQYGLVQSQDPAPGVTLEPGTKVSITVGKTPNMIEVVDYTGRSYEEARAGLTAAGFRVKRNEVDSDEPKGQVVNQKPNAGQQPENTVIELDVSNGSEQQIDMPDLTGMTEQEARNKLSQQGWSGDINKQTEEVSDPDQAGKVTNTVPEAGTKIDKDQTVTIIIGEHDGSTATSTDGGLIPGG